MQGEDRKERVANRDFAGDRGASSNHSGRTCDERPVGKDPMEEGEDQRTALRAGRPEKEER